MQGYIGNPVCCRIYIMAINQQFKESLTGWHNFYTKHKNTACSYMIASYVAVAIHTL